MKYQVSGINMNPVTVVGQSTSDHLSDVQELVSIIIGEQFNTGNVHDMIQILFSQVRFPPIFVFFGLQQKQFLTSIYFSKISPPQKKTKLYK